VLPFSVFRHPVPFQVTKTPSHSSLFSFLGPRRQEIEVHAPKRFSVLLLRSGALPLIHFFSAKCSPYPETHSCLPLPTPRVIEDWAYDLSLYSSFPPLFRPTDGSPSVFERAWDSFPCLHVQFFSFPLSWPWRPRSVSSLPLRGCPPPPITPNKDSANVCRHFAVYFRFCLKPHPPTHCKKSSFQGTLSFFPSFPFETLPALASRPVLTSLSGLQDKVAGD